MKIQEALSMVMEEVQSVAKKDRNQAQGFNFRGIDAVVNAVAPALRKHGVIVMPIVDSYNYQTVEVGKNRTTMAHVIVKVRYVFTGPEGDNYYCDVLGEAMDSGDKAIAKAMSVAFRIALLQSLALPTDEPDPDASSYERAPAKPKIDENVLADLDIAMQEAPDLDSLTALGQEANSYDLDAKTREHLRNVFVDRKKYLEESA